MEVIREGKEGLKSTDKTMRDTIPRKQAKHTYEEIPRWRRKYNVVVANI